MQAPTPREARKIETRERILRAAASLYLARGLDGVSMDEVAAEADRTKGAVYGHFADKQALLLELWRGHYAEKRALIFAALSTSGDLAATMSALGNAMVQVFALGAWPALAVDVRRRPEFARLAAELGGLERDELDALAAHIVAVRDRNGLEIAADPGEIAATLFALAEGLMLRPELSPETAARRFMAAVGGLVGPGLPAA